MIAATPKREDPRDVVLTRDGIPLHELRSGSTVGTGSPRRIAQVRRRAPGAEVVDIRGNVDSRLARVSTGELDAVILAAAGLSRLGAESPLRREELGLAEWPTAPGQGSLAVETREDAPEELRAALAGLDDLDTRLAITVERAILEGLDAGCQAPMAAHAVVDGSSIRVRTVVYSRRRRAPDRPRRHRRPERGVYSSERQWQWSGCCRWCRPGARSARARVHCCPSAARSRGGRPRTPRSNNPHDHFRNQQDRPLDGWRILVPRGGPWGDSVAASLRALGAVPVVAPLINFAPTTDQATLYTALAQLAAGEFDWLTVTSATTVDVLFAHRAVIPRSTKIAAVGETTAAPCRRSATR